MDPDNRVIRRADCTVHIFYVYKLKYMKTERKNIELSVHNNDSRQYLNIFIIISARPSHISTFKTKAHTTSDIRVYASADFLTPSSVGH